MSQNFVFKTYVYPKLSRKTLGGRLDPPGFGRVKQIVACRLVFNGVGSLDTDGSTPGPTSFSKFVTGMLHQSFRQRQNDRIYPFT